MALESTANLFSTQTLREVLWHFQRVLLSRNVHFENICHPPKYIRISYVYFCNDVRNQFEYIRSVCLKISDESSVALAVRTRTVLSNVSPWWWKHGWANKGHRPSVSTTINENILTTSSHLARLSAKRGLSLKAILSRTKDCLSQLQDKEVIIVRKWHLLQNAVIYASPPIPVKCWNGLRMVSLCNITYNSTIHSFSRSARQLSSSKLITLLSELAE